jgi:hypothetical protein
MWTPTLRSGIVFSPRLPMVNGSSYSSRIAGLAPPLLCRRSAPRRGVDPRGCPARAPPDFHQGRNHIVYDRGIAFSAPARGSGVSPPLQTTAGAGRARRHDNDNSQLEPVGAPPVALSLTVTEALYRQVMLMLAVAGRTAGEVPALASVVALLDNAHDLMLGSGALWQSSPVGRRTALRRRRDGAASQGRAGAVAVGDAEKDDCLWPAEVYALNPFPSKFARRGRRSLTAGPQDVKNRVQHLAHVDCAFAPAVTVRWDHRLDDRPSVRSLR